ncbi:phosphotransferase family protein [Glycomyces terrestris]|uniref:Aminoglycoside phosphotransferase family protein n=1 Tax=Glycomyces terrestris TaxID=2493553 RepID=A0A426V4J7_9ACTN|nr:phosphotransferase [Glycomyces terrestris]RRS01813.1 aminoglycoside phosphotransferase family protein [Glycomyces terrestris]
MYEVAIRPRLTRADVEALVRAHLGADLEFTAHEEFKDGFFNAAHALEIADGRHVVVKVAPDKDLKFLRYEVDLMATEIECFERGLAAGVPMPKLWAADPDAGVMIIDRLAGVPLPKVRAEIPADQLLALRKEIGAAAAKYATVTGEHFGYPRRSGRTMAATWSESFLAMTGDVLDDIEENGSPLPRPAAEFRALFAAERDLLDEVTRPALVHFDLWDGNIFVKRDGARWALEAFIDGERAFYGDPIAELVSLQMVPEEEFPAAVDGFLGRPLTAAEERRLALYRTYIMLILAAECKVRGFDPQQEANQMKWATDTLERDFTALRG